MDNPEQKYHYFTVLKQKVKNTTCSKIFFYLKTKIELLLFLPKYSILFNLKARYNLDSKKAIFHNMHVKYHMHQVGEGGAVLGSVCD